MNTIKITLKIKSPAIEKNDVDLTNLINEVLEAVNVFNDKFRDWSKRIIITKITKRAIHLILVIEKSTIAENISVREIRLFTQYLRNNKHWKQYTREEHKMFETVEFNKIDRETALDFLSSTKNNECLYKEQIEDIGFIEQYNCKKNIYDNKVEMKDEDIITLTEYLIKTKDKGHKADQKNEDLKKIKTILNKWL